MTCAVDSRGKVLSCLSCHQCFGSCVRARSKAFVEHATKTNARMRNAITLQNLRPLDQRSEKERLSLGRILAHRARFSFAHHREHGLWPQPKQEVCESSHESRTSGSSAHSQKFETITFVNSNSFIPSPRLRVYLAVARVRVLGADQKESGL